MHALPHSYLFLQILLIFNWFRRINQKIPLTLIVSMSANGVIFMYCKHQYMIWLPVASIETAIIGASSIKLLHIGNCYLEACEKIGDSVAIFCGVETT